MEVIGLLVKLEARPGKEADAEAFLKSAQPLASDFEMVCDQAWAKDVRHLRHLCERGGPQRPLDRRDREEVDGAGQRIIFGSSAGGKSGGPCKHALETLSAGFPNQRPMSRAGSRD